MQTERQEAASTQTKPTNLSCESHGRLLPSTTAIAIYCYYAAWKLILIFTVAPRWKAKSYSHYSKGVYSQCPRLYIAVAVVINVTARGDIQTWVLSYNSQNATTRPLRPADDGNNDGDTDAMVVILIECPILVEGII